MSLILDALRKADAERERGSVPSLHSHPVASPSAEAVPKSRNASTLPWVAIGLLAGVIVASAMWVIMGRGGPAPDASPVATAPASAPAANAAAPVTPMPVAPPAATPPAPPASAASVGTAGVAEPAPFRPAEERKAAPPEQKGSAPVAYLGNVPPPVATVYTREQLPPNVRSELPPITIGGSIYSPNPGGRSLIVNGQLFRERDRLTQDLSLEEIGLKAAVFSFRGYRFEVLF